ncbi:MAG: hypothetical protein Q7T82_16720 [Armatimonadota bacterium]|nr:hypothetical protein [Armatimonadota bacterium]
MKMKMKVMFIAVGMLLSAFALCWALGSVQSSSDVDIEIAKQGCRLAASALRSEQGKMTALVTSRTSDGGTQTVRAEYDISRSGQRFLLSSASTVIDVSMPSGADPDQYVKPGEVIHKALSFDGQTATRLMLDLNIANISAPDSTNGRAVVNEYGDEVGLPPYGIVDIGNLDQHIWHTQGYIGNGPTIVGKESVNGNDCTIVEMVWTNGSHSGMTLTETWRFWIDPARGYTVPKIRKWKQGGRYSGKTLVEEMDTELRQHANDVWAPSKVVHKSYRLDKDTAQPYLKQSKTMTYSADFGVNASVSDADLKLILPSGTKVHNELLDADYTVP